MKKLITLTVCVMLLGVAGSAFAVIDWAGFQWPLDGANVVPTGPVDVYAQVFKAGVTEGPTQGADLSGVLYYSTDIAPLEVSAPMFWNSGAIDNNDEYTAQVPQAALLGATTVTVRVVFTDATDATEYSVAPIVYNVVDVLPIDVTVRFTLCMSETPTTDVPCVIGSDPVIGAWGTGVNMTATATPELYTVDVIFPAESNPNFEYKYKKDGCADWESVGNRLVTLPTDGVTNFVELPMDSYNNAPMGCGFGTALDEDKVICFQVCMDGVAPPFGGVCIVGGIPELTMWGDGVPAQAIGGGLYQVCVVFEAGTAIPLEIPHKAKKDDCQTWEDGDNYIVVLDNSLAAETTVTHTWENGPGICEPVAVEEAAWGTIKGMYR